MQKQGFTLIELLVVVAIIGIIATIAIPNLVGSKDKAKEAEVKAGIHAIQTALESYAVDHDGNYPQTNAVIGGEKSEADILIKEEYLIEYPKNPFTEPEKPMRNSGINSFSQGDFGYQRTPDKPYDYILQGYGAKATSGKKKNGIIIQLKPTGGK